jgi:S-adenosylmethionine/arginine decarboxylase-like enzyme
MWCHNFSIPLKEFKDYQEMIDVMEEQLISSGFSIFGKLEKKFGETDITVMWGLCESHLACHSFSEIGEIQFQLASCNYEKYRNFLDLNAKEFGC